MIQIIKNVKINYLPNPVIDQLTMVSWELNHTVQEGTLRILHDLDNEIVFERKLNLKKNEWKNFEGLELAKESKYKVVIELKNGNDIYMSEESYFFTGTDWYQADWLTKEDHGKSGREEDLYSKKVSLDGKVKSAILYISSCGVYETYVNDGKIGNDLFAPGWTSYNHQIQYQAYEITNQLQNKDDFFLNIRVGNGWFLGGFTWKKLSHIYGEKKSVIAKCVIHYEDGRVMEVNSDDSWKTASGPILSSDIYDGELYDFSAQNADWLKITDRENWKSANVWDYPKKNLVAQINEPSRVTETIRPLSMFRTTNGMLAIDFGQNLVGRVRFKTDRVPESDWALTIKHAEVLDAEGNVYFGNLRTAEQQVEVKGTGGESIDYAPYFSFQGFRYIVIESEELDLKKDMFTAEVIHSDMERHGHFVSSDAMLNKLYENILWGQRGNFLDVPTDCPQRDERLGWTGDAQVFINTALYNYGGYPFFDKWLSDLRNDQMENGGVPAVIPDVLIHLDGGASHSSAAWGDAAVICPWELYKFYGNEEILKKSYDSMKRWITYNNKAGEYRYSGNKGFHYGDWLALDIENDTRGATPHEYIACCFHRYTTAIMTDVSTILKKEEDTNYFLKLLSEIDQYFQETYLSDDNLIYETQTSYVLALKMMKLTDIQKQKISATLNAKVVNKGYHLSTGFVGTPYLLEVLSDNNYASTAFALLHQKEYPSWMYSITQGATTIWEHWDSIKPDGSFWSDEMNSFNHYAYGAVGNWMYREILGIDQTESSIGFSDVLISPRVKGSHLRYVNGSYHSIKGLIESSWYLTADNKVGLTVKVPVHSTGNVVLRDAKYGSIKIDEDLNVDFDMKKNQYTIKVIPGKSHFIQYSLA